MSDRQAQQEQFFQRLADLESGDRAILKRSAGYTLSESRNGALGIFYRQLQPYDPIPEWEEENYFLIATLYPFERQDQRPNQLDNPDKEKTKRPDNFGASLHTIRKSENAAGLDRRVERLLDADKQQLPFYLRREVLYLVNQSRRPNCIDWSQLLNDLRNWDHSDRYVQRRWARAYFATKPETENA